jgi:capsular polysaccharide transport system permease protein
VVCVVVPVCIAAAYWIFIASDQYVAEFRFAVRDAKAAASATPEMSVPNMAGVATSGSTLENYMVADYLASPQAVEDLQSRIGIKRLYSRSGIDWLSRFDDRAPEEKFVRYWNRRITASYDQLTGLATAKVVAFTPDDAYLIAKTLVSMAEELVNNIATRPQRDAIRFAEEELRRAEGRLKEVNVRVAAFRNKEQVIDPQNNVVNSNVLLVQTLRANLAQLKTELASLKKQNLDPSAPMSLALQSRIKATKEQLAAVEAEVPNSRDGADPLSKVMGDYEQLDLERQFARDAVNSALRNLDQARFVALTQHLYVTTYVSPRLPESPAYPRRWLNIFITAFCSVLVWIVGLMLVRAIREHAA